MSFLFFSFFGGAFRGVFVFRDLALSVNLPVVQVELLATGREKKTLCSNHRLFLSLQRLLFSLLI